MAGWKAETVHKLRKLADDGMAWHEIGAVLGLPSHVVRAKARREGLVMPKYGVSPGSARPDPNAVLPIAERSGVGPAMLALRPNHCRWPIGSVEEPDFHYCSARRVNLERPYCARHEAVATSGSAAAKALTHIQVLTAAWTGVS